MTITIQKSTSGASFTILTPGQTVPTEYQAGDIVFRPNTDGTLSLMHKFAYLRDQNLFNLRASDIINGDTGLAFVDLAAVKTYFSANFFRSPGRGAGSTSQKTGTALVFTDEAIYGSVASPETGNITANITGAVLGCIVQIIHNNGSAPSFDSKFKILSSSGFYSTGQINYIFCEFINATEIIYSISQRT